MQALALPIREFRSNLHELTPNEVAAVSGGEGFWEDLGIWAAGGGAVGTLVGVAMSYGESQAVAFGMAANGGIAGIVAGSSFFIGYEIGSFLYDRWLWEWNMHMWDFLEQY